MKKPAQGPVFSLPYYQRNLGVLHLFNERDQFLGTPPQRFQSLGRLPHGFRGGGRNVIDLGNGFGDFLTLICAFGFACHIAYLGVTAEGKNPLLLTFMQLLTVGVLSAITFLLVEGGDTSGAQWNPGFLVLVYLAAFPSALCLFLQTFGQKCTPTSTSAVLLSFESLFGVVFSILFGMEDFTIKLLIGGVIVLASVIWLELKGTEETITHAVK